MSATAQPVDANLLCSWVLDANRRLGDLVDDLSDDQLCVPELETVNPLLWEIGHVTWFQESFVLRRALGEPPLVAHGDAIWDSAAIPHSTRWRLELPSRAETRSYMDQVAARVADRLVRPGATAQLRYIAQFAVHHHDMHAEALTYTRQALGYPSPRFDPDGPPEGAGPLPGDATIPGGTYWLGADRDEPFAFDNEKWVHPVELSPFRIALAPVTQAEHASFVDDGGYRTKSLWTDEGWAWRTGIGADHPVYWRGSAGNWERRDFDTWVALEAHLPVSHVSFYEAEAFCEWAGRRLPSEAEWEMAAVGEPGGDGLAASRRRFPWGDQPATPRRANLDWRHGGTVDVGAYPGGDSAFGCRQMIGNVWEWTASTFEAYPGFEQDGYRDNSWPWFGTRKVLRGGAWATRSRLMRSTLRNYFTPDRRDVFAGFRTAADPA